MSSSGFCVSFFYDSHQKLDENQEEPKQNKILEFSEKEMSEEDRKPLNASSNQQHEQTSSGGGGGGGDSSADYHVYNDNNNNDNDANVNDTPTRPKNRPPVTPLVTSGEQQPPHEYAVEEAWTCRQYMNFIASWMTAGLGMFSNAYIMLAVGNIGPLLQHSNADCWGKDNHPACSDALRSSFHYAVFIGIIGGMLSGGYIGDRFGRRKGSILTALVMLIGNIFITASYTGHDAGTFTLYAISLGIFGFGVGGEYPMTAAASAEKAEKEREEREKKNLGPAPDRGKKVVLPFTQQGLGNLVNTALILILLVAFGQTGNQYDNNSLTIIWRLQYGLGILPLSFLLFYRYYYLEESDSWTKMKERASPENRTIFFKYYWHRLIGTAGGWLVWDLAFYGNKVFQTKFIKLFLPPDAPVYKILLETMYNAMVAYVGYFFAVFTIDRMGRRNMQLMGFLIMFIFFTVGGIWFEQLTAPEGLTWLRLLYYATSFWGQWGPNATTWMFPAEVFPTHMRAFGHGLSGAMGPGLGALLGGLIFSYTDSRVAFFISGGCGLVGIGLTFLFLPELTEMNLGENDIFWNTLVHRHHGRVSTYEGEYTNYLSAFEKCWWYEWAIGESYQMQSPQLRAGTVANQKRNPNNATSAAASPTTGYGSAGQASLGAPGAFSSARSEMATEQGSSSASPSSTSFLSPGGGGGSSANRPLTPNTLRKEIAKPLAVHEKSSLLASPNTPGQGMSFPTVSDLSLPSPAGGRDQEEEEEEEERKQK